MNDIVIASAARTPVGSFNGVFAGLAASELGTVAITAALERASIAPEDVSEVIMGQILTAGAGQILRARQQLLQSYQSKYLPIVSISSVGQGLRRLHSAFRLLKMVTPLLLLLEARKV